MIAAPKQIWLAIEPVDMRLGMEGLSLRVQQALGKPPCDGSAYVFCNKRYNRIKLLMWDGTGVWLAQRRLHQGRFAWPQTQDATCALNAEEWQWLIAGVNWQRLNAQPQAHWRV